MYFISKADKDFQAKSTAMNSGKGDLEVSFQYFWFNVITFECNVHSYKRQVVNEQNANGGHKCGRTTSSSL